MSKDGKDGLMPCLFSRQGMKLDNMKFWRGDGKVIAETDFRRSLCEAEGRKREGVVKPSSGPPKCAQPAVDVREWLATM